VSGAVEQVVKALRAQGWAVEIEPKGDHYRASPPSGARAVRFQAHTTNTLPILRELRDHGFVWPPPPAPEPIVRATPFPAKPHPHVQVVRAAAAEEPPTPASGPMGGAELAFVELRDAKEYERLAAAELQEATKAADAAIAKRDEAAATYQGALDALAEKKRVFDRAFDGELGQGSAAATSRVVRRG